MNDYEAPLHLCDSRTLVPRQYAVFLHSGYSLEEHKQAVGNGADLNSSITNVFPERADHGLYYTAELHNASLDAVRADTGVDMVECDSELYLVD